MYILIYDFLHSIFRWEARRFWYQHCSVLSRDSHVLNKQLTMLWSYGELSIQRTIVQTESLQKDVCSDRTERLWSLIMPWIKNIQWHVCHVAIPSKKARFQISVMHGYVYVYIDVVIQTLQIYIIRCFETINVRQLWIVAAVRLYNIWNSTFTILYSLNRKTKEVHTELPQHWFLFEI